MINISTFKPVGNKNRCQEVYGAGQELLRITESLRAQMKIPFLSNRHVIDNGLTLIKVLALQDHNSQIEIVSQVPPEPPPAPAIHRERMLHCRVELTLAEDDLSYEKDPAFIAIEPIPVSENIVYLHVLFEVEKKCSLIVEELNGDDAEKEPKDISLEEAEELIYRETRYNLLTKLLDDDEAPVNIASQIEQVIPPEAIADETDFKDLMYSSLFGDTNKGTEELDGYVYVANMTNTNRIPTNSAWVDEPITRSESELLYPREYLEWVDEDGVEHRELIETDETEFTHLSQSLSSYYDSIEIEESTQNIHPFGNVNTEKLFNSYGLTMNVMSPFQWVVADFTPRNDDTVFIGDISIAATRNKVRYVQVYVYDEQLQMWVIKSFYPDAKLVSNILPYYIESKATKEIAEEFADLETDWQCYTRTPTELILSPSELGFDEFYPLDGNNWMMHPFMNKTWGSNLFDCRDRDNVWAQESGRSWYLHSGLSELYDIYDAFGYDTFHSLCVPNRMILCIRAFFANTENSTQFAGVRRSYDIDFPGAPVDGSNYGNRVTENGEAGPYDEIPVETSQPLSVGKCPNFVTIKGDAVTVNLMSSIYAVADYPAITTDMFILSDRHAGLDFVESVPDSGDAPTVTGKRPWPAMLDGNWDYTNIYGAGISIGYLSAYRNRLEEYTDSNVKNLISGAVPYKFWDRMSRGESIYSDDAEDISCRYAEDEEAMADVTWREEDTPESHLIHAIYRALDKAGYDKHHPVCDIKLEANLYDRYIDNKTLKVVEGVV